MISRGVGVVLATVFVAVSLAGCQDEKPAVSGPPSTSTAASASVSTARDPSTAPDACSVSGFVAKHGVVAEHIRPVVVFARSITVPPSSGANDDRDGARLDRVPIGIRVRHVDGPLLGEKRLAAADRTAILGSSGGPEGGLPGSAPLHYRLHNDSATDNRSYLVYRGSHSTAGRWMLRACGAPYNDGTEVTTLRGTFHTVGAIGRTRVAPCGLPAGPGDLARHAARLACS